MGNNERVASLADFRKDSAEQLSALIQDLNTHNKEHGPGVRLGAMLGAFMRAAVDGEEPDMQKASVDTALESAQAARARLAELQTKYGNVLNRFGLSISHEQSANLRAGLPSGPISMRVTDVHAFLRYAQSIKPVLAAGKETSEPFTTLLEIIEKQVSRIDFEHPSLADVSMLESLDAVLEGFRRIGPDLDLRTLGTYAIFQRTNRLQNYLAVEEARLWLPPGEGWGPADWITDISIPGLEQKWSEALSILREQARLGTAGVAKELREHLLMCIQKADERLDTAPWSDDTKEVFRKVMSKYEVEIRNVE